MNKKVFFVSLGCDKNLVDTEVMLGLLRDAGYEISNNEEEAEVIIVNTCSFIHDAKEESIETIIEMAQYKDENFGKCQCLIAVGCLTQRYQEELMEEMPELDGALGTANYDAIVLAVEAVLERNERYVAFSDIHHSPAPYFKRIGDQTVTYAYLKISEGCNNHCTYCIIPSLRGRHRSREMESLVEEVKYLVSQGKNEMVIVAQDTTKYGMDLYGHRALPELLRRICQVEGVDWIRLLYCYPEDITDELIEVMRQEPKILHYIDIPIQHISDTMLKKMARLSNQATIKSVIGRLRTAMPDICIRSSLIVGFPGETEEDFEELYEFVSEYELDRLGVFTYSLEEGTKAATLPDQIDASLMEERRNELMELQQNVSYHKNRQQVGKTITCIIEGYMMDEDMYVGRSYKDAPKVDGNVFVKTNYSLISGQLVPVYINECNAYDLIGEIIDESSE